MKRFLKTALLIVIVLAPGLTAFAQIGFRAKRHYSGYAKKSLEQNAWVNMDLKMINRFDDGGFQIDYKVSIHNDDGEYTYYLTSFGDDGIERVDRIDSGCLSIVNFETNEFAQIHKCKETDFFEFFRMQVENRLTYMPYYCQLVKGYSWLWSRRTVPFKVTDTVIRRRDCSKFISSTQTYVLNDKKFKYLTFTYVNHDDYVVDSVITYGKFKGDTSYFATIKYIIGNVNHDDKSLFYDSIFNADNPVYKKFSFHDENFLPYSMKGGSSDTVTEKLLSFPIVSLDSDTTTIAKENGWLLLDFWQFGCEPCFKQFIKFGCETDSLGSTILEQNGIKILSIHPYSDNLEAIATIGQKYNMKSHLYAAKGINNFIKIVGYPTYYLFSPNKEVVFTNFYLGDYSELLKAKETWEKQHPNYETK